MDERVKTEIVKAQSKMIQNRIDEYYNKIDKLGIKRDRKRNMQEETSMIDSKIKEYYERIGNLKVRLDYKNGKIKEIPVEIKKRKNKVYLEECQICGKKELLYWFLYQTNGLHLCRNCHKKEYNLIYG